MSSKERDKALEVCGYLFLGLVILVGVALLMGGSVSLSWGPTK